MPREEILAPRVRRLGLLLGACLAAAVLAGCGSSEGGGGGEGRAKAKLHRRSTRAAKNRPRLRAPRPPNGLAETGKDRTRRRRAPSRTARTRTGRRGPFEAQEKQLGPQQVVLALDAPSQERLSEEPQRRENEEVARIGRRTGSPQTLRSGRSPRSRRIQTAGGERKVSRRPGPAEKERDGQARRSAPQVAGAAAIRARGARRRAGRCAAGS